MEEILRLHGILLETSVSKVRLVEDISNLNGLLVAILEVELKLSLVLMPLDLRDPHCALQKFCVLTHDLLLKWCVYMLDEGRYAVVHGSLYWCKSDPKRAYEEVVYHKDILLWHKSALEHCLQSSQLQLLILLACESDWGLFEIVHQIEAPARLVFVMVAHLLLRVKRICVLHHFEFLENQKGLHPNLMRILYQV